MSEELKEEVKGKLDRIRSRMRRFSNLEIYDCSNFSVVEPNCFEIEFRSSKYAQHESYGYGDDYEGDRGELKTTLKKIVSTYLEFKSLEVNYHEKEWFSLEFSI